MHGCLSFYSGVSAFIITTAQIRASVKPALGGESYAGARGRMGFIMKIQSRDFGAVEIDASDIVTFVQPIFGFENYTRFVFLHDQDNSHIAWLQSLEDENLCFIVVDPEVVVDTYHPELPAETAALLGGEDCMLWLIMVVAQKFSESTVNLKSPIVLNPASRQAAQVLLEQNLPIRYSLASRGKGND